MKFLVIGAISGSLVVILGAFGAHGLKDILDEYGKSIYDKAVLYHMFHTMAILILGLIEKSQPELQLTLAGWVFIVGIILFSGSLYVLAVTGVTFWANPLRHFSTGPFSKKYGAPLDFKC